MSNHSCWQLGPGSPWMSVKVPRPKGVSPTSALWRGRVLEKTGQLDLLSYTHSAVCVTLGTARHKKGCPVHCWRCKKEEAVSIWTDLSPLLQILWFVLMPVQKHPLQAPHGGSGTRTRTSGKDDEKGWFVCFPPRGEKLNPDLSAMRYWVLYWGDTWLKQWTWMKN